ncbi:MAG: DegV family protein [Chloroflexi bacterium]|nr:DegV family protein [Chloroflexota bacterium]
MTHVAIVTDSAADFAPERAASLGINVVPLAVSFGAESFKAGVDLSSAEFWQRMTAPDAPFPKTAASSPGDFQAAYQACFDAGADAIVSIHVAGTLSGTLKSAEIARSMLPGRDIQIVDSTSASMGEGLLAELGADLAARGVGAPEIARILTERAADLNLYVALDTLEYLRRGGRISGAQAAIGTLLSFKPIITIKDGTVEAAERVRTRAKARERVIELLAARPVERLAILYTPPSEPESFREEVIAAMAGGIDPANVTVQVVGPSVGPHLGPGCLGGVVLYRRD